MGIWQSDGNLAVHRNRLIAYGVPLFATEATMAFTIIQRATDDPNMFPLKLLRAIQQTGLEQAKCLNAAYSLKFFGMSRQGHRILCAYHIAPRLVVSDLKMLRGHWSCANEDEALKWFNVFTAVFGDPETSDILGFGRERYDGATASAS